ncbi:hypothetical protein CYY_010108, partial [Polysphondylium violaceum]
MNAGVNTGEKTAPVVVANPILNKDCILSLNRAYRYDDVYSFSWMMKWNHFQLLLDKLKHEPHVIYYPSAKQTIHLIATSLNSDQHLELLELLYQQLFLTFSANEINVDSVLNVSVTCNNTTFYKFIQSKGHCINDKGEALIMAASKSNLDLLQLIIKTPSSIMKSVETWQNVLIKALEKKNHEMVELIM